MTASAVPLVVLSLGAGVQSSTLALMASCGEFTDPPTAAVFADTQAEPASVYRWLDWLGPRLAFPVRRITKGDLGVDALRVRTSKAGVAYTKHAVPAFIRDPDGRTGLLMRQCTLDHKIDPLYREYNRLRERRPVVQWIGISRDEASRIKPARRKWVTNRYPLIEVGMTRRDCLAWMRAHGYPEPPRSACVFCPYHSDAEWARLKRDEPEEFERAVAFEGAYQDTMRRVGRMRGTAWLHRSCAPLAQVDFERPDPQLDLFDEECEGVCAL